MCINEFQLVDEYSWMDNMRLVMRKVKLNSNYHDYALAAGEYEFEDTVLKAQYFSNKTTIKIVKKDTETKAALKGAKFNI